MIRTENYASLDEAINDFKTQSKSILQDETKHRHFQPRHKRRRPHARSAGGGNHQNRRNKR